MKHSRFINIADSVQQKLSNECCEDAETFAKNLWRTLTALYQIENDKTHETREIVRLRSKNLTWDEIATTLQIDIEDARGQYAVFEEVYGTAKLTALCDFSPSISLFGVDESVDSFNIEEAISSFGRLPKQKYKKNKINIPKEVTDTPMFGMLATKN